MAVTAYAGSPTVALAGAADVNDTVCGAFATVVDRDHCGAAAQAALPAWSARTVQARRDEGHGRSGR